MGAKADEEAMRLALHLPAFGSSGSHLQLVLEGLGTPPKASLPDYSKEILGSSLTHSFWEAQSAP